MKIAVISDSHGNKKGVDKVFENGNFDYLFFLGDGINDLGLYKNLDNVFAVSGNCDFFSSVPSERIFELNGIKFLITHGNKFGVKGTLGALISYAKEMNVDYVFYGHTHNQKIEQFGNIYYINPGSFQKNSSNVSTGLIIDIDKNKEPSVSLLKIN